MKPLDEFLKNINPYAPGCAIPSAHFGIRQAAIEFCERTRLWRYNETFDVTAAEAEGIVTPCDSVLLDIEQVKFNGQKLNPATTTWLDCHMPGWDEGTLTGTPRYFSQIDLNTIILVPFEAGTVSFRAWLKPSQDCTELPDFLSDQYRETIAHGALGRILMTPNMPYTNGTLGAAFLANFTAKIDGLTNKVAAGQQRARVRTKATFF